MKQTLNINLSGYPFTIDDDAYQLLKDYLDTIRYAFETQEDTEDLASDIESRIAELLIEKENGNRRIVTRDEISRVIERIGKPSEFIEVDETQINVENPRHENQDEPVNEKHSTECLNPTPPPYEKIKFSRNPFVRKRIFRDPQNAMLGGVCAGLAAYLHIDVTVVRLITVLLFFLSATTVAIIYIILWIVVPDARTPLQRMQMFGEDTTVENIGKTVTGNYNEENQNYDQDSRTRFPKFISAALSFFVTCLIIIGLIIASPLLFALAVVAFCCFIALFAIAVGLYTGTMFDTALEGQMVFFILLAVIGGAITLGIPLWLFIRRFWRKKEFAPNPSVRRSLLIVWVCGIALLSVFTVKAVKKGQQIERWENSRWKINKEKLKKVDTMDEKDIEGVTINENGITFQTKNGDMDVVTKEKVKEISEENKEVKEDTVKSVAQEKIIIEDSGKTEVIVNDTIKVDPIK